MIRLNQGEQELRKQMLKSGLAAAAPAIVPAVLLLSVDSVAILKTLGLGRLGVAAAGVIFLTLAWFLFQRRWWAGLPALAMFAGWGAVFLVKTIRPLFAYFSYNPLFGSGSALTPMILILPALVVLAICFVLGRLLLRGMKASWVEGPRPLSHKAWGVLAIWLVVLIGDAAYQDFGWQHFDNPRDLVVRLCLDQEEIRNEVQARLTAIGPKAVPALLLAMASPDPGLECLRKNSKEVLIRMDAAARPALLQQAGLGNEQALLVLQETGGPPEARALEELLTAPDRPRAPEYDRLLEETIARIEQETSTH